MDVGKKADLLILSLDPLENISNTQSIESIIAQGRHLDEADITKLTAQSSEGTLMLDILSVLYKLITALGFSLF